MNIEEHRKYRRKYRAEHAEQENERNRKRRAENIERYREGLRKRKAEDLNLNGVTKNHIRKTSREILKICHTKLQGYEIHHCFGYEEPNKFVYIPKALHNKIHRFLWDNGIPADTDHWMKIRDLVNSCEEYTYIRA